MSDHEETPRLLSTERPDLFFEDNTVGRCKKEVWDASDEEIDRIDQAFAARMSDPSIYILGPLMVSTWASKPGSEVCILTLKFSPGARYVLPAAGEGVNRALYFFAGKSMTPQESRGCFESAMVSLTALLRSARGERRC